MDKVDIVADIRAAMDQDYKPTQKMVRVLLKEYDRLTALCDGYRGEIGSAQEPPTCFDDWWKSTKYGLPHWGQPHIFMPLDIGRDSFAAGYRLGKKERQSALTRARAEGMEDKADAERWRAVIGCARVRALGCAGIINRREDGYAHIGVELWTRHEAGIEPMAIEWLTAFADIAVSLRATKGDSDEG